MQNGQKMMSAGAATRILIAEDHFDSREALRMLLAAFGFDVVEAINGREAVERALEAPPHLILMDVMMPEMDGFEAIRMLREKDETREIPIIAVTALDGAHDIALDAGADDYVRKPVDIRSLIGLVHGWLERGTN